MQDEGSSPFAALRREPERALGLVKLSLVAVGAVVAWDVLGGMAVSTVIVEAGLALLVILYGAAMAHFVARIMGANDGWASGSAAAASRLSARPGRGVDVQSLRRRPQAPSLTAGPDAATPSAPASPHPTAAEQVAFNQSYFLMRLQEQVKDARRAGHEMCVAAVHVTLPGMESSPEFAEAVAYDIARIAAEQSRVMSPPLALSDSEYVFSLPHTGLDDTKQFVREVVRALGEYWCYFGIAAFPDHATAAEALVEKAREACEASLDSGKRGRASSTP